MRDWRSINGKRVWTSDRHHYVLQAWAEVADSPLTLVSFDSHTDTRPAFSRASKNGTPIPQIDWSNLQEVRSVIPNLWHDEHIDAALKAGYLDRALIILAVPTPGSTTGVGELLLSTLQERELNDTLLEDATLKPKLAHAEPLKDFILDIDLDSFRSLTPLYPQNGAYFDSLIRRARCITVAREAECVAALRFDDVLSTDLEQALYARIAAAIGE